MSSTDWELTGFAQRSFTHTARHTFGTRSVFGVSPSGNSTVASVTLRRFGVQSAAVDLPRSAADDEDLSSGRGRGSVVCSIRITGANVRQHSHSTAFR